jgi:Fe2+ or Zn2+ uptake regulation protein
MRDTAIEPTPDASGEARLRAALEKAGWRFTRQRAAVFAFLSTTPDHPTAEQVHAAVRRQVPNISLATVYKALDALVAARLASRIADEHGPTRYDGNAAEHYHLRCLATGQVRDLPLAYDARLPEKLCAELVDGLRRQGFVVTGHRLELLGHFTDR